MNELLLTLTTPALIIGAIAAGSLVVLTDWRLSFIALFLVYVGMTILLSPLVLTTIAGAKLLVGALVVGILAITGAELNYGRPWIEPNTAEAKPSPRPILATPTNFPFRVTAAIMVGSAAWYVSTQAGYVLPGLDAHPAINHAAFQLMALGLLNLGLTEEPLNAGMGLLVLLLGFELFYAAVEPSLAVMALLVGVEFAIALAVSYLALVGHRPIPTPEAN